MLGRKPPAGYVKVGEGEHSEVFRRPGSRYCLQQFTLDCPETPERVRREYRYLRETYAGMPGLIPHQRLLLPSPRAHIWETRLIKQWIGVDPSLPLNRIRRSDLNTLRSAQMDRFLSITRRLLKEVPRSEVLLPDIIDPRFRNLAFDTGGRLRLLDTNGLITTRAMRELRPDQALDIHRHPRQARWLQRLMYLDAAFCGRSTDRLRRDPLYARYLTEEDFDALFHARAEAEEAL